MNKYAIKKITSYSILFVFFVLIMILFRNLKITPGDDIVYKDAMNNIHFFRWLNTYYQEWSGRVILTSLLMFFLNQSLLIFKIINAIFVVILIFSVAKISSNSSNFWNKILAFSLIILIPEKYISSTIFWFTGSLNYLWPTASLLYVLSFIFRSTQEELNLNYLYYLIITILTIFASNSEQTALVLMTYSTIYLILEYLNKKRINRFVLYVFFITSITTIVTFFSPGNIVRLDVEILSLNPSFELLNVVDKLFIGFNYTSNVLFNDFEYHLLLLSIILFILNRKESISNRLISFLPIIILLLRILFNWLFVYYPYCTQCNDLNYILFNFRYFEVFYLSEIDHIVPILLAITVYTSITLNIYFCKKLDISSRIFLSLLFLAALFSSIVLGFSPTIEASGNRIYFFMIMASITMLIYFINKIEFKIYNIEIKYILYLILFAKTIQTIYQFSKIIDYIIVY